MSHGQSAGISREILCQYVVGLRTILINMKSDIERQQVVFLRQSVCTESNTHVINQGFSAAAVYTAMRKPVETLIENFKAKTDVPQLTADIATAEKALTEQRAINNLPRSLLRRALFCLFSFFRVPPENMPALTQRAQITDAALQALANVKKQIEISPQPGLTS